MRKMAIVGSRVVGAFATLALMVASSLAFAQSAPAAAAPHHDPAAMVQRFDANKDGKLQVTELPDRLRTKLVSADTNKDGVLSVDEIKAFRAAQVQAHFARADKNSDGSIDASEAGQHWARIQVADGNKDGKVTLPELQAAHAAGLMHGAGHRGGHRGRR